MDRTDEMLLEMIRENARMSYQELGTALGMSRVAAKKRVKKLEDEGIIRGYITSVDLKQEVTMMIDIVTVEGKMDDVIEVLTHRMAYIRRIFRTTGGNHVHVIAVSDNAANLGYLVKMITKKCGKKIVSLDHHIVKEVFWDEG